MVLPDGNGRMSRLLTTLMLYRSGYVIGRYISLESKIAKNKNLYYNALEQCQKGWTENAEDSTPFIKYLLQTILAAYRDFEERVMLVDEKLPAIETVCRTVYNRSASSPRVKSWSFARHSASFRRERNQAACRTGTACKARDRTQHILYKR